MKGINGINGVRALSALAGTLFTVASCDSMSGPKARVPIDVRLTVSPRASTASTGSGPLQITALRLVVGAASLGSGDQFGCVDCQGNTEQGPVTPKVIDVRLDGEPVLVATEQVAPGLYSQAEIAVETPTSSTLAGTPGWPGNATVVVEGRFNGTLFRLPLSITGSFRETLIPPVQVSATTPPSVVAVTITLPVAGWFTSNGTALDPSNPAQRAQIEANARSAFQPPEKGTESQGAEREP